MLFTLAMILIIEVIRATAFQVIYLFLPPTTTWGSVMDVHRRHWHTLLLEPAPFTSQAQTP